MAKRGEKLPFTVRFQFDGQPEYAARAFHSREAAEFARDVQANRVGPNGETCRAWIVERTA